MTKSNTVNTSSAGNAVMVALAALVLAGGGAAAYFSGMIGGKDGAATSGPQDTQMASAEGASEEGTKMVIKPGNPVVANLDGKDIKRADVLSFIQTLGAQTQQMPLDQLFPLALEQVIASELISKKVANVNLDNDPAVKAQLAAAKRQIVRTVFVQKEVEKLLTDERLQAAYAQYTATFPDIPEVKTRHILVKEEDLAKDLIKQLEGGADFAALATEHSIDSTKENGGELGYIAKQDQVLPEFLEASFEMEVGEMSKKPVKSRFGYHIIEVQEKRMRPPAEFEQVKPFLASQLRNVALNELVAKWRNQSDISVFDINGEPIEPAAGGDMPPIAEPPVPEAAPVAADPTPMPEDQ